MHTFSRIGLISIAFLVFLLAPVCGAQGNSASFNPSISSDGRYVAFDTASSNLVAGDSNNAYDVFVRDRQSGVTTRVSKNTAGTEGDGGSERPSISSDGRYVAFESDATNLVTGDTNGAKDIFVRDRQSGVTTRVSKNTAGTEGDGNSERPSISSDGRYVAFESDATSLVSGDANGARDIFVRDRQAGITTRVSKSSAGAEGDAASDYPAISANGRYVTFQSDATNLVSGDTNTALDIFVRDRQAGVTTRVSKNTAGDEGWIDSYYPAISADGRYMTFTSWATNLVSGDTNAATDIFVRDRQAGVTTRVSKSTAGVEGDGESWYPTVSSDGRYVAFDSYATNLVPGDTNVKRDCFVRDRQTGTTYLVSRSSAGTGGDGVSALPAISGDGRYVAFESVAANLVSLDTNGMRDIFVRDRTTGTTTLVSKS